MSAELRDVIKRVLASEPENRAYKPGDPPFIAVDQCLGSRAVWRAVKQLVASGLASGGTTLWHEMYLNPDGSVALVDGGADSRAALAVLRGNRSLRRMPFPDSKIAEGVACLFFTNRCIVVLSADLGSESNGLRTLLTHAVGGALHRQGCELSLTLVLKRGSTDEAAFVAGLQVEFARGTPRPGFREVII